MARSNTPPASAPDGRTLAFAEWGDPGGFPVFFLHGTPNSRFARHYDESKYSEAGARVITYDRPGYGGSDRHRGRRIVDCAADVVAIADSLELERFAVAGASGGGPHALAVAARVPDRVTRAACMVSPAPYDVADFDWLEGMDPLNVREVEGARRGEEGPGAELGREAGQVVGGVAADPARIVGEEWGLAEAHRVELARPERHDVIRQDVGEAFRRGIFGWVDDDLALVAPWGFDISEIRIPMRVVYGLTDVLVPARHGHWLARNVPGAEVVVEEDLGHFTHPDLVVERMSWLVQPV